MKNIFVLFTFVVVYAPIVYATEIKLSHIELYGRGGGGHIDTVLTSDVYPDLGKTCLTIQYKGSSQSNTVIPGPSTSCIKGGAFINPSLSTTEGTKQESFGWFGGGSLNTLKTIYKSADGRFCIINYFAGYMEAKGTLPSYSLSCFNE